MDRFLVHSADVPGPATHALVIGVSAYPHLLGGTGPVTGRHEGMGQLTSPGPSARAVASWLIENLRDPGKPLATVALLSAEQVAQPFRNPATGETHSVEPASMAAMTDAIEGWGSRGGDPADRLLFYFCGHGIANGREVSLLSADYGANPRNQLADALDFSGLWLGMEAVAAREQCFFVDACRANSSTALGASGYRGDPVYLPDVANLPMPALAPRQAPVFYSTILGQDAYGRPQRPSPFTEALVRALSGAGGDDNEGDWRVSTTGLKRAIDFFMDRAFAAGAQQAQVPATNNLSTFFLHYLDGKPEAQVFVGCRPEQANAFADFSYRKDGVIVDRREPANGDWELTLSPGDYEFVADFATGGYRHAVKQWYVHPPYRKVPLEVFP